MLGFWVVLLLMAGWQGARLVDEGEWRQLVVFSVVWLTAVIYGSLAISELNLISPFQLIINLLE